MIPGETVSAKSNASPALASTYIRSHRVTLELSRITIGITYTIARTRGAAVAIMSEINSCGNSIEYHAHVSTHHQRLALALLGKTASMIMTSLLLHFFSPLLHDVAKILDYIIGDTKVCRKKNNLL